MNIRHQEIWVPEIARQLPNDKIFLFDAEQLAETKKPGTPVRKPG